MQFNRGTLKDLIETAETTKAVEIRKEYEAFITSVFSKYGNAEQKDQAMSILSGVELDDSAIENGDDPFANLRSYIFSELDKSKKFKESDYFKQYFSKEGFRKSIKDIDPDKIIESVAKQTSTFKEMQATGSSDLLSRLYNSLSSQSQKDALSGAHMKSRLELMRANTDALYDDKWTYDESGVFGKGTVGDTLKQIAEKASSMGIGTYFSAGDNSGTIRIGFYDQRNRGKIFDGGDTPNWDQMAYTDFALADDTGTVWRNSVGKINHIVPFLDENGNLRVTSLMEESAQALLDQMDSISYKVRNGNIEGAMSSMEAAQNDVFEHSGSASVNSVVEESRESFGPDKSFNSRIASRGLVSIGRLAREIQKKYQVFKDYKGNVIAPEDLSDGVADIGRAIKILASGMAGVTTVDREKNRALYDILYSPDMEGLRDILRQYTSNIPVILKAQKEESFLDGFLGTISSWNYSVGAIFETESSRSVDQQQNYLERLNNSSVGSANMAYTDSGLALGVDYSAKETALYTGIRSTDEKIRAAWEKFTNKEGKRPDLAAFTPSLQDGIIALSTLAEDITAIQHETAVENLPQEKTKEILRKFKIDAKQFEKLGHGNAIDITGGTIAAGDSFSFGGTTLRAGDTLKSIKKAEDGSYEFYISRLAKAEQGLERGD